MHGCHADATRLGSFVAICCDLCSSELQLVCGELSVARCGCVDAELLPALFSLVPTRFQK